MRRLLEKIFTEEGYKVAEVQFFFQVKLQGVDTTVALVANYSAPDATLMEKSSGALAVCQFLGQQSLEVIKIEFIHSVVGMVPYPHTEVQDCFFLVERMGYDIAYLGGYTEEMTEEGEGNAPQRQTEH